MKRRDYIRKVIACLNSIKLLITYTIHMQFIFVIFEILLYSITIKHFFSLISNDVSFNKTMKRVHLD